MDERVRAGLIRAHRAWTAAAAALAAAQTRAVLFLFYYLALTPYAWLLRAAGLRLLDTRLRDRDSYWIPKEPVDGPASYERLF